MQLLTEELRAQLPKLYAQTDNPNPTIHAKFFRPDNNWTWLVVEGSPVKEENGDKEDFKFFGYVIGDFERWDYFLLSELKLAHGPRGLPIERDLQFEPAPLSQVITTYRYKHSQV